MRGNLIIHIFAQSFVRTSFSDSGRRVSRTRLTNAVVNSLLPLPMRCFGIKPFTLSLITYTSFSSPSDISNRGDMSLPNPLVRIVGSCQPRWPVSIIVISVMGKGWSEGRVVARIEGFVGFAFTLLVVIQRDSFSLPFGVGVGGFVDPRTWTRRHAGVIWNSGGNTNSNP